MYFVGGTTANIDDYREGDTNLQFLGSLKSSVSKQRFVPKTNLNIGKHAFSVAVPTIQNQLPRSNYQQRACDFEVTFVCIQLLYIDIY